MTSPSTATRLSCSPSTRIHRARKSRSRSRITGRRWLCGRPSCPSRRINKPEFGHYVLMGKSRLGRPLATLLIALAAVFAVISPASSATAAPADTAAAAVEPSVVQITTRIDYQQAIGTGTGIVIDPGGAVLTNYHVVAGANSIQGSGGGRDYAANLIGYDRKHDVAVIQLLGAVGLPSAPIGDSGSVAPGEPTVAL